MCFPLIASRVSAAKCGRNSIQVCVAKMATFSTSKNLSLIVSLPMLSLLLLVVNVYPSNCQSTLCVWDSVNNRDHLNGEYIRNGSQKQNGHPYWQKASRSCTSSNAMRYLKAATSPFNSQLWWAIDDGLPDDNAYNQWCQQGDAEEMHPADCNQWGYKNGLFLGCCLSMTVRNGTCPSLSCDAVRVSNTGSTDCDRIFHRDPDIHENANIFSNDSTYLYFNELTFRWYCSDTLGDEECGDDDDITHYHVSSKADGWTDVDLGGSFVLELDNGYNAIFECIQITSSPTPNPSIYPTVNPTVYPSAAPTTTTTNEPTDGYTINPTSNPTIPPTMQPTMDPTLEPISAPTIDPTTEPTYLVLLTSYLNRLISHN